MSPDQTASPTENQSEREIVLTRVVDAPRALVWRIWTEPEHLPQWWGPSGFTTTTQELELRPGGRWRFTMHGPDGRDYPNLITWLRVEEPSRLVYRHGGGEQDLEDLSFETEVTLEELGPTRTRVTLRSIFPSAEACEHVVREYGAIEGGKQHLARLAEHAARLAEGPPGAAHDFVLRRVFDAPRPLVWELWTSLEHLTRWLGPEGSALEDCRLEFRPGGVFLYRMRFPGMPDHWARWVFREIVPGERLVFVGSFADAAGESARAFFDENWPLKTLSTVTFEDHAGKGRGTLVTLRWSPMEATLAELRAFEAGSAGMEQGWTGSFDRLQACLAARGGSPG